MAIRLTIAWAASDMRLSTYSERPAVRIGDRDLTRYVVNVFNLIRDCGCRSSLKPCIVHRDCEPGTSVRAFIFWAALQSRRYEKLEADAPPRYAIFTYGITRVRRYYLGQRTTQQEVAAPPALLHANPTRGEDNPRKLRHPHSRSGNGGANV